MDDLSLQAPGETLDYAFDWTEWLNGDSLSTSAWSIAPAAGTVIADQSIAGNVTDAFVGGLALGQVYVLANIVTTAGGSTGQRTIAIRCWAE